MAFDPCQPLRHCIFAAGHTLKPEIPTTAGLHPTYSTNSYCTSDNLIKSSLFQIGSRTRAIGRTLASVQSICHLSWQWRHH